MRFVLFLCLAVFSTLAQAQSKEFTIRTKQGLEFLILRQEVLPGEPSFWMVDVYRMAPGELQTRVEQRQFYSQGRAQAYVSKYKKANELPVPVQGDSGRRASPAMPTTTEVPGNVLWKVTQSWSWDWEVKFAQWTQNNLKPDFFQRYGIATDCADVAIGARWIFSRINGLPVGNTLAGSGVLFSQASMKSVWSTLPRATEWSQDQVFRAALDYVMDNTYTKSLLKDSYPVAINNQVFLPGVHHLEFHSEGGHTMVVTGIEAYGRAAKMTLVQSTVPRDFRMLAVVDYQRGQAPTREEGFMRIRWTEKSGKGWVLKSPSSHPGFSLQQYDSDFTSGAGGFSMAVKAKLMSGYDGLDDFKSLISQLRDSLRSRVTAVEMGYMACQQTNCAKGTAAWEEWSTPVRDSRLKDQLNMLIKTYEKNSKDRRYQNEWGRFLNGREIFVGNRIVVTQDILNNVALGKITSDPREDIERRWGF